MQNYFIDTEIIGSIQLGKVELEIGGLTILKICFWRWNLWFETFLLGLFS